MAKANIFIINGYGIPKNILKDENYSLYLKMAFNAIYDISQSKRTDRIHIFFSGGKTDCFKPYKRTEAEEMKKYLSTYLASKPYLKEFISRTSLYMEKNALSTLENFLNTKELLHKSRIKGNIIIICEKTRELRIKNLVRRIFGKTSVLPIDFDISANRYLDKKFLNKKEKKILAFDLWALKSGKNLKKHHDLFEKRIAYLRKAGSKNQVEAVKEWWERELSKIKI